MRATAALLRELDAPMPLEEVELPEPAGSEVLVRIRGVGVCHTELTAHAGGVPLPLPAVLGHEGAGVVEAVGPDVTGVEPGDHVVLTFDSCGACPPCNSGHPAYCELFAPLNYFGTRLDGSATMRQDGSDVHGSWFGQSSFATYALASARNAVKVDATLPIELLGPLGCGLQTGAGAVFNVLRPRAGQSIAVFGIGTVGLAAVMAAKAAGCDPIVAVDVKPERLALARELGATHTFDPGASDDLVWDILAVAPGPGLDFSLEAVGAGAVVRQALEVLKSPGTCATLGLQALENEITIDQGHLLIGRTLTGVIEGDADPQRFIPELIALWRAGRFPFDRLIETFPFEAINDALAAAAAGAVVKPVVVLP